MPGAAAWFIISDVYGAGTVVAGKYRIEHVLGQGGMGFVVAATHLQLGTPVALKFLHEHMLTNQSVVDRFMREARASAKLRGENVCRVSDVGALDNGCPYIVMELLYGQDITTVLRNTGAMPVPTAAEIVLQACLAVGEAHAAGIIHRDLKPGNLMWTQRPDGAACIKVLDFGVAKAPEDVNFSLTQTASVIGSPGYMSPEQLKSSKAVDPRSDIWSLGVVLFELVSGRPPFHGESITELALKVTLDPTPPLMGVVPQPFEVVIARCLEKNPDRRYQDVAQLASALAPFVGPRGNEMAFGVSRVLRGASAPAIPATPITPTTPTTLRGASGAMAGSATGSRSWMVPAIVGGLGAAIGIGIAVLIMGGGDKTTPAASAPTEPAQKMESTAPTKPDVAAKPDAVKTDTTATTNTTKPDPKTDVAAKTDTDTTAKTETTAKTATAAKTDVVNAAATTKTSAKPDAAKTDVAKTDPAKTATAAKTDVVNAAATTKTNAKTDAAKTETTKSAKTDSAVAETDATRKKTTKPKTDTTKTDTTTTDTTTTKTTTKADTTKTDTTKTDTTKTKTKTKADTTKTTTKADTTKTTTKADTTKTTTKADTTKADTTKTKTKDDTTKKTKPKEDVGDSRF